MSKMIQVRNVPDRLHRELTRRARARGQNLTDYVQQILEREVARPPALEVFERIGKEGASASWWSRGRSHQTGASVQGGLLRIVVADASALVEYLLRTEHSEWIGAAIGNANHDLHVPAPCDVEVAAALRRAILLGALDEPRAEEAVEDYLDLPITRHGHQSLVVRMLELRNNFSVYDATYVALAGASRR